MTVRDHTGIAIDTFKGLWDRGDKDSTPRDHFTEANNLDHIGTASIGIRPGIGISQTVAVPLSNIRRIYNYLTPTGNTLIVLAIDGSNGKIYHVVSPTLVFGPVLTIAGMEDFAFVSYAGRAYISPFSSRPNVTASPISSPAAATATVGGSALENGTHKYAYTYVTASGETTPSPISSATVDSVGIANPIIAPVMTLIAGAPILLTNGGSYKWKITYCIDSTHETQVGPVSNTIVYNNTKTVGLQLAVGSIPAAVVYIRVYRTVAGGSVYYRESDISSKSNYFDPASGNYTIAGGNFDDTNLVLQPQEPTSNSTTNNAVNLSGIIALTPDVTDRKIYRSIAGGTQLKLLAALGDNTTTVYQDIISDASLGANAPTTNSAVVAGSISQERGLEGQFIYVYGGDGTAARKAAGLPLTGTMTVANGAAGHTDPGIHLFGFVSETDTGYLSPPGLLTQFTTSPNNSVSFGSVDTSPDPHVVKRHLVATIKLDTFNGDLQGYSYFFVPNATINNNTDTFLNNISFYDADLLDDASHLFDNLTELPAAATMALYHNRLCFASTFSDIVSVFVSEPGEPEAFNQITGICATVPDGNAITNLQELRDILYVFKRARTDAFADNGDVPSAWPRTTIDFALGTSVHGVATVLDSGASSVDFLIVCTFQGISTFNGRYASPELSLKVEAFWRRQNRLNFRKIQIINAPIGKKIYCVLPDRTLLTGNYVNGMTYKDIEWEPWSFFMGVNTVAIVNIDDIILGADLVTP